MGKNKKGLISKKEIISYGLASPAVNIGALLCASFLSSYYTDVVGIPVAAVGMIFLVSRIFDGITDVCMGVIVDKTNTRWGKAKPWIFIGSIGTAIMTALVFGVPQMGTTQMIIYAGITYFLLSGIFNTMTGISVSTMTALISDDSDDRTALGASFFTVQMITTLILMVGTLPLVEVLGGGNKGWRVYTIIVGVLGLVFLFILLKNTKERFAAGAEEAKKITVGGAVKALFQNKYFILITLTGMMINVMSALINGVGVYYSVQILGNANYFSILSIASMLPYFAIPLCVPIMAKFGKTKTVVMGLAVSLAASMIMLINPESLACAFISLLFRGIGSAPVLASYNAFVAESADYGQWKTGVPLQGVSFSGTSFGNKVGAGLGGALMGWVLAAAGYDGMAAVQTASALTAIKGLFIFGSALPIAAMIVLVIPFKKLEGLQEQIHTDLYGEK
ncbi:MAG: MFS transporter [Dorea sp.]